MRLTQLEREGVPSAALAAELLLMHTLESDRAWIYAHTEQKLDVAVREKYFSLVAQRASGVPTQHPPPAIRSSGVSNSKSRRTC